MAEDGTADFVADTLRIQHLKARYCAAADCLPTDLRKARAQLDSVLSETARADYGNGLLDGRGAIIEFLATQIADNRDWLYHALHTPLVEIDGDAASGSWTVTAMMKAKGSKTVETAIGRYLDSFTRTPQGWRISALRFIREGN